MVVCQHVWRINKWIELNCYCFNGLLSSKWNYNSLDCISDRKNLVSCAPVTSVRCGWATHFIFTLWDWCYMYMYLRVPLCLSLRNWRLINRSNVFIHESKKNPINKKLPKLAFYNTVAGNIIYRDQKSQRFLFGIVKMLKSCVRLL